MSDCENTSLPRVIVSISGGALSAVYCDKPVELYLFDWDTIDAGGCPDTQKGLDGFRDYGDLCTLAGEAFDQHAGDYVQQAAEIKAEQEKLSKEMEEQ